VAARPIGRTERCDLELNSGKGEVRISVWAPQLRASAQVEHLALKLEFDVLNQRSRFPYSKNKHEERHNWSNSCNTSYQIVLTSLAVVMSG